MQNVEMIPVQSSNVVAIGWGKDDSLYVEYLNGTYRYLGVDKTIFEELLASKSKGKYINENIKGKYSYMKALF